MTENKRILVLTLSFGSGHVRAAQSVFAELQKQMPAAELHLADALEHCSLPFRAFYVWTYWWMIRHAPQIWNRFFHRRLERRDEQTAPVWFWKKGCQKIFDEIRQFQPDFIVAAEVGASEIAVIARRENMTNAGILNVITDFEAEPIWVKPEISAFAVASKAVKNQLENWGANREKIRVCGIPLDASFDENHDARKIRAQFGLDKRPLVLLMGGGMGPTRMDAVAARLLRTDENLQIIALAGRDARARRELKKLKDSETVTLRVFGWTNQIAALMKEAIVLATKPGGLTLSEAAACGLPCVLFDAIPGPEEINAELFVKAGAGVLTRGSNETVSEILRLLGDETARREMSENIGNLARPQAAREIVALIIETLESKNTATEVSLAAQISSNAEKIFDARSDSQNSKKFSAQFGFAGNREKTVENLNSTLEAKN